MKFIKIIFMLFLLNNANAKNIAIDNITLIKIKKLISNEEKIAIAYKNFLKKEGSLPTLELLIKKDFLDEEIVSSKYFRKKTSLDSLKAIIFSNIKTKSHLYDYYMSNSNRKYTKAYSINNKIAIVLNKKEKFIFKNHNNILKYNASNSSINQTNGYFLDKGVLSWYDEKSEYKYSITKSNDLIIDNSITIFNQDTFIKTDQFNSLFKDKSTGLDKNILYNGQKLFHNKNGKALEYININNKVRKVGRAQKDIGKTVVQFTRRGGGIIINGDVYTWGNNDKKATGINKNDYTGRTKTGTVPVINSLVRVKSKSYIPNMPSEYFSSALRAKFVDFFSSVYHSTCAISLKGELYCNGAANSSSYPNYDLNVESSQSPRIDEMMYRSKFFNGSKDHKANKIFANNAIWLILANGTKDGDGVKGADIYSIGPDYSGFTGNGSKSSTSYTPVKINNGDIKFRDITYSLTIGYRKMAALSEDGHVYLWGIEQNNSNSRCQENTIYFDDKYIYSGNYVNLCKALKVSDRKFKSIKGSMESFVASTFDNKYYKIYQVKENSLIYIKTKSLNTIISNYEDLVNTNNSYDKEVDNNILSVDVSSKLVDKKLVFNEGVVWVNANNQLKGDYFTSSNREDPLFINAIKKIKWKKIKVIEDGNAMCGIDIYHQMYCWGVMSYYRTNYPAGNTFMIPTFNTNLYSLDKDYIVSEGGYSNYLTNMTDGDWSITDKKGNQDAFFMKYPTYIGGFNYEFIFK